MNSGSFPGCFMKKVVFTVVILLLAFGCVSAQRTVSLRQGDQKTLHGGIHIKFLEVTDDSRCPVNTTCIWAGNAKVKIAVSRGKAKAITYDLNSTLDPTE